jgi:DNA processing protein
MEAAVRSGSLISARRAADFGRLVFAVPGSPIDPRAAGTNQLLKDGATLVTSAEDIVEALAPLSPGMARPAHAPAAIEEDGQDNPIDDRQPDDSERAQIVAALGAAPVEIDDVIAHTGLAPAAVYLVLLELDLAGRLDRHPGGRVSLSVADL